MGGRTVGAVLVGGAGGAVVGLLGWVTGGRLCGGMLGGWLVGGLFGPELGA